MKAAKFDGLRRKTGRPLFVKDSKGAKLAYAHFEEEPAPIIGQDASLCWRL
jgi:hypothetical protein